MNKLAGHPGVKRDAAMHKSYLKLVKEKAPGVFEAVEEVKARIEEKLRAYDDRKKMLDDIHRREEALTAQRVADEEKRQQHESSSGDDRAELRSTSPEFDDSKFDEHLRRFRAAVTNAVDHQSQASYPELPHLVHQQQKWTSHQREVHVDPPSLPPKPAIIADESHPPIPPKLSESTAVEPRTHKSLAKTEGGKPLKTIFLPLSLESKFLDTAMPNTQKKLETCGILCGKLSLDAFFITTLVIPQQESTENTCQTKDEETMFEYIDSKNLFVLGWIHTHPTQSCFLSSIDLHTHNAYQIMLPEAIAMVCSPSKTPSLGIFRLTDPTGMNIISKCNRAGFHPHDEHGLYTTCDRKQHAGHVITKDGLPFECVDLRKQ